MSDDRLLADSVDIGLIHLDHAGRIRLWNRWIAQRATRTAAEAEGMTLVEAFGKHIDPRLNLVVREAIDFGWTARLSHALHPMPLPLFPPGSDGTQRMMQAIDVTPTHDGTRRSCLLQVRDVTETVHREALLKQQAHQLRNDLLRLSRAQEELQRSEMRFRELARQAPAGLFEADADARCTFLNERCEQLLGRELAQVAGSPWPELLPLTDQDRIRDRWQLAVKSATRFSEEFRYIHPSGRTLWLRAEAGALRDHHGQIRGFIGTIVDITEFHERASRNEFRANHDSLTGQLNRDHFERHLRSAITGAREVTDRVALLFIDLDDFKLINDTHGHQAGDTVLKVVAYRVRRVVRAEDRVARYGGDEFAVLLYEAGDTRTLASIVGKITHAVAMPINLGHCHVRIGCSIGMAVFPDDAQDLNGLLSHADLRMYDTKRGRAARPGQPPATP